MKLKKYLLAALFCFGVVSCGNETKDEPKKENEQQDSGKKDESGEQGGDTGEKTPEALTPAQAFPTDFDYTKFEVTGAPSGINVSYYSDIYSRGFAWFTNEATTDTKLYYVESGLNYNADFTNATFVEGETIPCVYSGNGEGFSTTTVGYEAKSKSGGSTLNVNVHKVHVENLKKNTSYSYKIGSESGWKYGAFTTEKENPTSVTAIQLSDAQTYHPEMLSTFRTTMTEAVKVAGSDLDTVLYNGDYFDQNMKTVNDQTINRILRFTKASDAIEDVKSMLPFMSSSGNHEPTCPHSSVMGIDVNFGAKDYKGGSYSYNYGPAHFIVLNANRLADDDLTDEDYLAQINWLTADLASDACKNAKWKVVMMHIGAYTTGDHSNEADNQRIVERLTPLFSSNHVDLVLQAHEHTYNKTYPYKWDAAGYSTTFNNSAVVNFAPETTTIGDKKYDLNPQGTYYVTTGAAGHRAGSGGKDGKHEYEDGIWAEVKVKQDGTLEAAYSSKTYLNNKYKCENAKLNVASTSASYTTSKSVTVNGQRNIGDPATACVDGQMFGVLNISETTLTYDAYLIPTGTTSSILFDTLNIAKQ